MQDVEFLQQRLSVADVEHLFIGVLSTPVSVEWVQIGGMDWFNQAGCTSWHQCCLSTSKSVQRQS
jgi:hypothetical protein